MEEQNQSHKTRKGGRKREKERRTQKETEGQKNRDRETHTEKDSMNYNPQLQLTAKRDQ